MNSFDFFKEIYHKENDRRQEILNHLNIPITILTALATIDYFIITNFVYEVGKWSKFLFVALTAFAILFLFVSIVYLILSFGDFKKEYTYKQLPYPDQLFQLYRDLNEFDKKFAIYEQEIKNYDEILSAYQNKVAKFNEEVTLHNKEVEKYNKELKPDEEPAPFVELINDDKAPLPDNRIVERTISDFEDFLKESFIKFAHHNMVINDSKLAFIYNGRKFLFVSLVFTFLSLIPFTYNYFIKPKEIHKIEIVPSISNSELFKSNICEM